MKDEAVSGKLIMIALALALLAANSPLSEWYESVLHSNLTVGLDTWNLSLDLRDWISEGLMVFFFLVVGLELKREIVHGELRRKESALLPFAAAIGGMVVPALIYVAFNLGKVTIGGWAIPTATDIALAVGVIALLGSRIPTSIRIFLLALAIVDDILAVIIIAVFYSTNLNVTALISMAVLTLIIYLLCRFMRLPMWGFALGGAAIWLLTFESGTHPSITGAILGLIAPVNSGKRIAERTEKALIPFTTLVVVPLFVFANTGISLDIGKLDSDTAWSIGGGIVAGLVLGKLAGIVGASWLMVKAGFARLPSGSSWKHIVGVGSLAGIGFTVAIFVTDLAFSDTDYIHAAKLSIFFASTIAATIGMITLRLAKERVS